MHSSNIKVTYTYSFGVEHVPNKIKEFIRNKNMQANMFLIKAYDSVMCGYFCEFIDFMLKYKSLTDFNNPISPNDLKNNDIILILLFPKWMKHIILFQI